MKIVKRLYPLLISVVLLVGAIAGLVIYNSNRIKETSFGIKYINADVRNDSYVAMQEVLKENSILVMGSSELFTLDENAYPSTLFRNGNSNFNMILYGSGYKQSLYHAIAIGALEEYVPNRKVILILSPQWFVPGSPSAAAYASKFSERMFAKFVANKSISYETKRAICDRTEELIKDQDPTEYTRVLQYDHSYVEKNAGVSERLYLSVWNLIRNYHQNQVFYEDTTVMDFDGDAVKVEELDFAELLRNAEEIGNSECTNNPYQIYDDYYTIHVQPIEVERKDSNIGASFLESPEYGDLQLFLDVCKETGITPMLVSVPVKGIWYDYCGWSQEDRQEYYQKIRNIAEENNVALLDCSDHEYEDYFLKDIMHMGWKGWVYLDEAVYRFNKENCETVGYPFEITAKFIGDEVVGDGNLTEVVVSQHISDVNEAVLEVDGKEIKLQKNEQGFLAGKYDGDVTGITSKTAILRGTGVYGASIIANATVKVMRTVILLGNPETSADVIVSEGNIVFDSGELESQFNSVGFQLFDEEGNYIRNFGFNTGKGEYSGEYIHALPTGVYRVVFKVNGSKHDAVIWQMENLIEGETYLYTYSINRLTSNYAEVGNFKLWSKSGEAE